MDLYGIGFANIRMSNIKNDYTYIYDYRINTFPEEVYVHEFLHTLERILTEYNYEVPVLHDNEEYGYEQKELIGLKDWYQDYMRCNILNKSTNEYIGLDEIVYSLKPTHKSNFQFPANIEFNKEPTNLFEDIKALINVIVAAI